MATSQSAEVKDKLRRVRESFRDDLPRRIEALDAAWRRLRDEGPGGEAAAESYRQAHGLAGAAGTFDFPLISALARALEQRFDPLMNSSDQPGAGELGSIDAMVARLAELCAEAAGPVGSEAGGIAAKQEPVEGSRLVVFLADDPVQAEELALQIGHFGYQSRVVADAALLKSALADTHTEAVVVDLECFQRRSGVAEALRGVRDAGSSAVPIVFISSRGDMQARLAAVRAGGDAFFTKPLDFDALADQLDAMAERSRDPAYRVLVVDDDENVAAYFSELLRSAGMQVATVTHPLEAMNAVAAAKPELILMDLYMPGCSGSELAKVIRQQAEYADVPIVFVSQEQDYDRRLIALKTGVDDFLTKMVAPGQLISSVAIRADRARLLRSMMTRDSLTGVLNHTSLKQQLAVELARARRHNRPLSFAMLDLDHFKQVNDRYGHLAGDRVLKTLARLLRQRLRRSDYVGRYGGEEFAVVLPDTTLDVAWELVDGMRRSFGRITHRQEGQSYRVYFSAGVAAFPERGNAEDLIHEADQALYTAKEEGRNRVVAAGTAPV
jgi:diguanylate cyclase (GGDEF)-like protein